MTQTYAGLPSDLNVHFVDNIDTAWEMKRWIGERHDVIGLDTETSGLNPYAPDAKLRMIQIGDQRAGWAIPWELWGGVALEILNAWGGLFSVHNLPFDAKWLKHHAGWDVPWERTHDTMIMYNMLHPGAPAALKTITKVHIDPRAAAGQEYLDAEMKKNGWGWGDIPINNEGYWTYSALDPVLTAHAWSFLRADLVYPESFDLEMNTLRICSNMEDRGIYIDVDYCIRKRDELEEYIENAKKWGKENLGISISSNPQLADYFKNTLGANLTQLTPGGSPSMDKKVMAALVNDSNPRVARLATFIEEVRKADKIRGSYFENFIKDNTNGVLHPSIKTMQAISGRMSITNPAMQTLHKNDTIVRNAVIPREGDRWLLSSDLDQVEFRIFSHLSQDEGLLGTFRTADATGGDPFTEIGKQVYQDPNFTKKDPRRGLVKSTIYGRLYGAGVAKMAETAGVPVSVMQEVNSALDEAYPGIRQYQKTLERQIEKRGRAEEQYYIETLVTNRRIPVDKDKIYVGLNYTIQSSAAEIFKANLGKLDAAGLGDYMLVPVHDEIVLSLPPDADLDEVRQILTECMTTSEGWAIPLTSGTEGPFERWGMK